MAGLDRVPTSYVGERTVESGGKLALFDHGEEQTVPERWR